jgi:hypothetical protein
MLELFFTVDVEIWCGSWNDLDSRFKGAYNRYIYGPTASGHYGLPFQLRLLNDHGLHGVFFVESLFAARFGNDPLAEILGLIADSSQESQLHVHAEWVDEVAKLRGNVIPKRQHLHMFSESEQTSIIRDAAELFERAGGSRANAFRAGSFGFNLDTLRAVAANGIAFDSSYNALLSAGTAVCCPGTSFVSRRRRAAYMNTR